MREYTKKEIDQVIFVLEIRGFMGDQLLMISEIAESLGLQREGLLYDCFTGVNHRLNDVDVPSTGMADALEAAARLREGKLPGTPEWNQ